MSARASVTYIGLGSNLGEREEQLREALLELSALGTIEAISSVWRTEPVGYPDQPDFWNLVVRLRTGEEPVKLLDALQRIERGMGRRRSFPNAPRPIDLDILFYGDVELSTQTLTVPHPRVLERGFTLRLLCELDPTLLHPATHRSIAQHLADSANLERGERLFPGEWLLQRGQAARPDRRAGSSDNDDPGRSGA